MSIHEMFGNVLCSRSREIFDAGHRTPISSIHPSLRSIIPTLLTRLGVREGTPLLCSTYLGGTVLTITTDVACHFVETEKLPFAEQKAIRIAHEEAGRRRFVADGTAAQKRVDAKVGRNNLCPCGSGKKFKKCCLGRGS
jgi:uncharacterized protein YchJ